MKTSTRRAVAHIAGSLISGHTTATIYDYQDKRHVNMSGDIKTGGVAVYDYEQRCHITGSGGSLYHHGNRAHITLQVNGASLQATMATDAARWIETTPISENDRRKICYGNAAALFGLPR